MNSFGREHSGRVSTGSLFNGDASRLIARHFDQGIGFGNRGAKVAANERQLREEFFTDSEGRVQGFEGLGSVNYYLGAFGPGQGLCQGQLQ